MWPYFLMFLVPAAAAVNERRAPPKAGAPVSLGLIAFALLLCGLIGFRFEVGGDWGNYVKNLDEAAFRTFTDSLSWTDPAYRVLEWLMHELGGGIVGINLITGTIFTFGLAYFCRDLPRPWLALTVAVPYLVLIVGMGYTRQAVAIGCVMIGLVGLGRQRVLQFLVWVILGALFHRSAVLLLPIAALAATRRRIYVVFWVLITTVIAYFAVLEDSIDSLRSGYIDAEYESEGALVRLLMNAVPAVLLLLRSRRFAMTPSMLQLWRWFAIISLALLIAFYVSPSSTAVDRVALYMLPLQLVVFAHLPEGLGSLRSRNSLLVMAIILYYALVQIVWLNFANNAGYWVPYRFYPAEIWF
jgi:hypothetical protein